MTSCNSHMSMTDYHRHSSASETEYRAIGERVTETTILLPFSLVQVCRRTFVCFFRQGLIACFQNFFRFNYYRVICSLCSTPPFKGVLFISPLLGVIHGHGLRTMHIEHIPIRWKMCLTTFGSLDLLTSAFRWLDENV